MIKKRPPTKPVAKKAPSKRVSVKGAVKKRVRKKKAAVARPAPYLRQLERRGSLSIWLVDGADVRKNIDIEFSNFGSHYTVDVIPKNEIWLDGETSRALEDTAERCAGLVRERAPCPQCLRYRVHGRRSRARVRVHPARRGMDR